MKPRSGYTCVFRFVFVITDIKGYYSSGALAPLQESYQILTLAITSLKVTFPSRRFLFKVKISSELGSPPTTIITESLK
jgi:hypothetical protein